MSKRVAHILARALGVFLVPREAGTGTWYFRRLASSTRFLSP